MASKDKYLKKIIKSLKDFCKDKNVKCFVFGSSLDKTRFGDVDVGIKGNISESEIFNLKEFFKQSTIPYFVDVVDFNKVSQSFENNVIKDKVLWIKR